MIRKLNLIQNMHEHRVGSSIVPKIYKILKEENDFHEGILDIANSNLVGEITLLGPAYEEHINYINEIFPDIEINPTEYYILCNDPVMLNILLNADISGDGIGLVQADFDAVTNFSPIVTAIQNNKEELTDISVIEKFSNIQYNIYYVSGPFNNMPNLKYACLPENCDMKNGMVHENYIDKQIHEYAGVFQDCPKLEYVKICLKNLTKIAHNAFKNCTNPNLKIDLCNNNNSLTRLDAFRGCRFRRLEECLINYDFTKLESINGFGKNTNLESFRLYKGINDIGAGTFGECTNLTEFIVDEEGADITLQGTEYYGPPGAMFYETNIDTINWHKRVKQINGNLGGITGNTTMRMIFENTTPPEVTNENAMFRHFQGQIYVPNDYVDDYKSAWPTWATRIHPISEYVA